MPNQPVPNQAVPNQPMPDAPASRIAIVTDSNSQFPADLAVRLGVEIVDIPVIIDDVEYPERSIDVDDFYRRLGHGAVVTTSQPSPGQFAALYQTLVKQGASSIVSIHVGSALSGTVNSARLAAQGIDAVIEIVDSQQSSFSIALAVWAACDARDRGADAQGVAAAAAAATIANVFVLGALDIAASSGRVTISASEATEATTIPVVALSGTDLQVVGYAADIAEASEAMLEVVAAQPGPIRIGIGVGDEAASEFYNTLEPALVAMDHVVEVVRYRCGPSVGAFSGPGVAGLAWMSLS